MSINMQAERVAADMDRTFRSLAGRGAASIAATEGGAGRGRRRGLRWIVFGAPVMIAAAGVAVSYNYVGDEWRAHIAAANPAAPVVPRAAASSAQPVAAERADAAPSDLGPATGTYGQERSQTDTPVDPAPSRDARAIPPAPYGDATMVGPAASDAADGAQYRGSASSMDRAARPRRRAASNANAAGCAPGSQSDQCIYQDVLNADGRLRRAYERARQDGVSSRALTDIGRAWRKARSRAEDDPDGTIRRYDQLADALDDLGRGAVR